MQKKVLSVLCAVGLIAGSAVQLTYLNSASAQGLGDRSRAGASNNFAGQLAGTTVLGDPRAAEGPTAENFNKRSQELLATYNESEDEAERAKIVKELTVVASQEFDVRQELREQQLRQLDNQLKSLRVLHARRAKEKDEIVKDRVRQLLRDADGLGWGDERSASADFHSGELPKAGLGIGSAPRTEAAGTVAKGGSGK